MTVEPGAVSVILMSSVLEQGGLQKPDGEYIRTKFYFATFLVVIRSFGRSI